MTSPQARFPSPARTYLACRRANSVRIASGCKWSSKTRTARSITSPVGSIIADPFAANGLAKAAERKSKVLELMELVGLNPEHYNRFPADSQVVSDNASVLPGPWPCAQNS